MDVAIDWLVELDPFANGKLFDRRLVLLVRRGLVVDVDVTIEDLLKAEFVTLPSSTRDRTRARKRSESFWLGLRETVHVSELLEIPAVVAGTDLVGMSAASMGSLMEERLGLQVLPAFRLRIASSADLHDLA